MEEQPVQQSAHKPTSARESLRKALSESARELAAIEEELVQRKKRELRAWEDEEPALQAYAAAMSQTAGVMRSELDKLRNELYTAFQSPQPTSVPAQKNSHTDAVEELQKEIQRLIQHMETVDKQLQECRSSYAQAQYVEDKALWETQLVALQDTKNLTMAELERLRVELVLKQRAADSQQQQQCGQAKIKQLQDELASTISKVDRVKQLLHFPSVEGYRFRSAATELLDEKDAQQFVSSSVRHYSVTPVQLVLSKLLRSVLQATVSIKLGGEPPRMSFSAHTPPQSKAPVPSIISPSRSSSRGENPNYSSGMSPESVPNLSTSSRLPPQPPRSYGQAIQRRGGIVSAPIDDSMVPSEAPKQGIWFDRAPFDAATASPSTLDRDHQRLQRSTSRSTRTGRPLAEASEGERGGDLIAFNDDIEDSEWAHTDADPFSKVSGQGGRTSSARLIDAFNCDSGGLSDVNSELVSQPSERLDPNFSQESGPLELGPTSKHPGSRKAAMRLKATSMAAALATRSSRSKKAAVGLLNKLSSALPLPTCPQVKART